LPFIAGYKHADGKKIDGRRVLVDVERGRTVKGWLPRRLGGGLGGTRKGGDNQNVRSSGRDDGRGERRRRSRSGSRGRGGDRDRKPRRSRSRDRKKRSRSRDRKRSRSRDRKRSRKSRSRSRDRRRKERENGDGDGNVKDEPTDKGYDAQVAKAGNPEDYGNVEVKQEKE